MILETARLRLRELRPGQDDAFILELLNSPGFIENIGDRGVRDLVAANVYVVEGPAKSYREHGFGLWLVELKASGEPIGMCGLIKREGLDAPDIGYALLERYAGQGHATEAAAATLAYGQGWLGLERIVAITAPDNAASMAVLLKIGMTAAGTVWLQSHGGESRLFTT